MAPETILAWQKLYSAVTLLAAICSACAVLKTCYDVRAGVLAPRGKTIKGWIIWLPRLWLHFQLAYFLGFPSILAIAVLYAHYIGFGSRPSRWCNFGCGRGPSSGGFGGDV